MDRRTTRRRDARGKRNTTRLAVISAVVVALVGLAAVGYGVVRYRNAQAATAAALAAAPEVTTKASTAVAVAAASTAVDASASVEVPSVLGLPLSEARLVLDAAGLRVRIDGSPKGSETQSSVATQSPSPGEVVSADTVVVLSAVKGVKASSTSTTGGPAPVDDGLVVVIDPGHQQRSDSKPEPIGPKSHKTKVGVSGGTTGAATKLAEYEVALQISMNLKERLEAAGVKVIMTRTTNDVRLTNSQRAKVANDARADLFVRVHCDGSPEAKDSGISTLYPASNKWTKPIVARSKTAASAVQAHLIESTGAIDRGLSARGDLTGFNYSKVPAILVESGFMSNPVEDRLLASPHYQDKLAEGMAEGILAYLAGTSQ
ncbi:MAG TPA: N-acetylmuramoyl-L-alanine amidase [Coriobacteriia bacterium]|nr:N-acetylmuramoyl-L-alanine amidase [Coriobacteriia bacterium]